MSITGISGLTAAASTTVTPSVIQLSPSSQIFVDRRITTLGPWVIGSSLDCLFMGIILCQVMHFFHNRRARSSGQFETVLVVIVTLLSVFKTCQSIAIIWIQNVIQYMNPDVAQNLVSDAWYQVSAPLMTGIIGCVVQTFFAWRFFKLTRNWLISSIITAAMGLGIIGISFSTYEITQKNIKRKVMFLLIHLVSVFIADLIITVSTIWALWKRNTGMSGTTSLIHRLLRMIFEAALPPAFIATVDLILTQTLGAHLLWHLVLNYALAKLYVISLLYTLNSISDLRAEASTHHWSMSGGVRVTRRGDMELGSRLYTDTGRNLNQVQIETQVTTHTSPVEVVAISDVHRSLEAKDVNYVVENHWDDKYGQY
ncbi:hypothetical protein C8J56DRAFT_1033333 [Mycena floridula]|nr:hypothetical protein C8J56DRAFT_1033333 [Mycena floridula]